MSQMKSLADIFTTRSEKEELYTSDQAKRKRRENRGRITKKDGFFDFISLIRSWEEVVGKLMAQNTTPLKIKGTTLFITTKHPIFAQELGFLAPKIIEKIQDRFPQLCGKVTSIKFSHSKLSANDLRKETVVNKEVKPKLKKIHKFSPQYHEALFKAEELFKEIEDKELKEALIDFYLSSQ